MKTKSNNDIGKLQILNIKDNPDGSATMEFEVDEVFEKNYLKATKKKKVTKEGVAKYVLKMLRNAVQGKNGYAVQKVTE